MQFLIVTLCVSIGILECKDIMIHISVIYFVASLPSKFLFKIFPDWSFCSHICQSYHYMRGYDSVIGWKNRLVEEYCVIGVAPMLKQSFAEAEYTSRFSEIFQHKLERINKNDTPQV